MRKTQSNEELMTTREAGEVLGVAVRTVQLWVESGVLPAWRTAGGHRRIARSAVARLQAERARVLAVGPEHAGDQADASAATGVKVLLVEDDADQLRLFTSLVEGWSYPVQLSTAANGFEGLIRIGQLQPDMVITDLNMPGMDGFQMIRSLKKADPEFSKMEIVVVTAYGPDEIEERGGLPGGVRVFQKPVAFADIEAIGRGRYQAAQDVPA